MPQFPGTPHRTLDDRRSTSVQSLVKKRNQFPCNSSTSSNVPAEIFEPNGREQNADEEASIVQFLEPGVASAFPGYEGYRSRTPSCPSWLMFASLLLLRESAKTGSF